MRKSGKVLKDLEQKLLSDQMQDALRLFEEQNPEKSHLTHTLLGKVGALNDACIAFTDQLSRLQYQLLGSGQNDFLNTIDFYDYASHVLKKGISKESINAILDRSGAWLPKKQFGHPEDAFKKISVKSETGIEQTTVFSMEANIFRDNKMLRYLKKKMLISSLQN